MADPWPVHGVLAVTKLHIPDRHARLIERSSLVRRLCAPERARLTLISAPAGAGKTTLLAEWHAAPAETRPFAWLTLDADDGDPVRFWTLVIEALRTVHPGFGEPALSALRSVRGRLRDVIVPLLINDAVRLEGETVLVLDDLHLVAAAEVHESLAYFVDRLPGTLSVAIATRVDPPLPLARLRVRGALREVRASDLRLSDAEAGALLREGFGVRLEPAQLQRLQARTEGWAAAVQLAGLALSRGADPEAMDGVHTGVLEYLAREVLDEQDDATRRFLVDTSILERLSAPLCDAVTGGDDAAARLPELDRRNLLVVPLDPARVWWRYHHLFADVLRARLSHPHAVELHRRALAWHTAHGLPGDAIRHALAAGESRHAADLIAAHWSEAFNRGELATVERWLAALPAGTVVADTRLWLAQLWLLMDRGRLVEAGTLLADLPADAPAEVRIWTLLLEALHAFKVGDAGGAEDRVAQALELDPADRFWRTVAALVRGLAGYALGRVGAAKAFAEAARLAHADGNRLGEAYALGYLALIAAETGTRTPPFAASAVSEHVVAFAAETGTRAPPFAASAVSEHFVAFAGGLARATLDEREGRYEAAAAELARAEELAERGAGVSERAQVIVTLGQVQWARGRRDEARALARDARAVLAGARDPGRVGERLTRLEQRVRVRERVPAGGDPTAALTESERAVLQLLAAGLSNRAIGGQLYISVNTVKSHLRNLYAKLGVTSRDQAVGRAREFGAL